MPKKAHKELFPGVDLSKPETKGEWVWVGYALASNYKLVKVLKSAKATSENLRWLLWCESSNKARPDIMRRIITRLATLERNRLYKLLNIKK